MPDTLRAEVVGSLGILTLDRAKALNALDTEMAVAAREALEAWRDDPRIQAVWLEGAGDKAFCAGGDVRAIVEAWRDDPSDAFARRYFEAEYRLDFLLHTYPKPVVVWGHGFVLGGGVGMFLGGTVRIVTGSTRLGMPEIRIGLFPDVGASWFLSRAGAAGVWLALTAARVTAGDALDLGLADVYVQEGHRDTLREALGSADLSAGMEALVGVIAPFVAPSGHRFLAARELRLSELLVGDDDAILAAVAALRDDADPWLAAGAKTFASGSPRSARLILEQLRRARTMSLADVFRQDLTLAVNCVRHPDFHEGVRAVLIDKDQAPSWSSVPSSADVDAAFASPFDGAHPLSDLVATGRHERAATTEAL